MFDFQAKITRHGKNQENITPNKETNQPVETG